MKNLDLKTKALAVLIALALTGGTAVTATSSLAKDSLNDDVKMAVTALRLDLDSERYSKDSGHESDERGGSDLDDGRNHNDSKTGGITLEEAIKIATGDTQGDLSRSSSRGAVMR